MVADKEFYYSTYHGKLSEADVEGCLARAEYMLHSLTLDRLQDGAWEQDETLAKCVRMAHCALADAQHAQDTAVLAGGPGAVLWMWLTGVFGMATKYAETFAADCMAVMQRAADAGLGFTCYHFSADEDIDDGISYYLDCVASYPAGLTAAQVAQRVQTSYHYDNNSFSSEADRDDYIRRQLQNEISDEYADRHDGAYPDEKYLNEETERRFAERTGMATPESAQA